MLAWQDIEHAAHRVSLVLAVPVNGSQPNPESALEASNLLWRFWIAFVCSTWLIRTPKYEQYQ